LQRRSILAALDAEFSAGFRPLRPCGIPLLDQLVGAHKSRFANNSRPQLRCQWWQAFRTWPWAVQSLLSRMGRAIHPRAWLQQVGVRVPRAKFRDFAVAQAPDVRALKGEVILKS
jgi:hypothetical protein